MTRCVNGMHLPNQGMWHIEQMLRAAKTTGAVTILHEFMFENNTLSDSRGDPENENWYGKLRYGWAPQGIPPAPERLIHIRIYTSNWRDHDPKDVARKADAMLANWRSAGRDGPVLTANLWDDPFVCVSPCNEQNLEPTGARDYAVMANWQRAFWREIDLLLPNRKALSCLGAWAFGTDIIPDVPDSEYTVPEVRSLCEYVDVLATHPYAMFDRPEPAGSASADPERDGYFYLLRDFRPAGWRDSRQPGHKHDIGGILAQFPGKPLLITESGTFVHGDKSRTAETVAAMRLLLDTAAKSGRVLGVTWFIWNSGPEHAGNRIWYNADLRAALEAMPEYTTTCRVPVRGALPTTHLDIEAVKAAANAEQAAHGIRLNPEAAIQKLILADGMVPVTNETAYADASGRYVIQVGQSLATNAEHVAYVYSGYTGKIVRVPL